MAVLGYLPKLRRALGQPFGQHFLNDFSIKRQSVIVKNP